MNVPTHNIDILENTLRHTGNLLDVLLLDRTTKKNLIWATDSYEKISKEFASEKQIALIRFLKSSAFGVILHWVNLDNRISFIVISLSLNVMAGKLGSGIEFKLIQRV